MQKITEKDVHQVNLQADDDNEKFDDEDEINLTLRSEAVMNIVLEKLIDKINQP